MFKIFIITLALYLFLEVLCHGFALFMRKCLSKVVIQDQTKPLSLQFIQQTFYRTMLLVSIALMNHLYGEVAWFAQNDWIRFTWSITVALLIVLVLYGLNAFIIRQVILKQQQSVIAVFKQKFSYIMLHPLEFRHLYRTESYLSKSVWINRFLSITALILLFLDVQILYNVAHS
ncbi:hypothetical protein [uncultured Acinetobacter sp.]|uniref:hypothetical protein n=1 Tax=uncultured Acinetobacter sp. TaxID=165433 RepID=UPI0025FB3862|nr:hypothetical protein [uncultured Acinetobacter sp.]